MATDRSRSTLQALLVQDTAWDSGCLATDSSYTGISPLPGTPQPAASTYAMGLGASGSYADATKTLTVTTQQGGIVGRQGATFRWKNGGSDYGWDAPTVISGWSPVVWSTTDSKEHTSVLPLSDGQLLVAWAQGTFFDTIYTATRSTAGVWSAPSAVTTTGSWAVSCCPCLIQLSSGKILLYAWVKNISASTAIVRCLQSDDNGATWTQTASGSFPAAVSTDGATGYTLKSLRGAALDGQVLLVVWLVDNRGVPPLATVDEFRQYASSDGGNTFSLVYQSSTSTASDARSWPAVCTDGASFFVSLLNYNNDPTIYTLPSAYLSIADCTPATISLATATLETVIVSDETGVLFLSARLEGTGNRWVAWASTDGGATWVPMAKSTLAASTGVWWDAEDNDTYPQDIHSCWYRGQWLLVGGFASAPSTYGGHSLACYTLGGYTTVTMPGYDPQRTDAEQVTWGQTWLPLDLPEDSGWIRTIVGTPTESLSTGLLALTVGVPEAIAYSVVPTGTVDGGVIAEWAATVTSGAYRVRLRTADGASGYQLTVSCSSTGFTATDGKSGTVLATVSAAGEVWVKASITAGVCSLWYRVATDPTTSTRAWTQAVTAVALTDGVATWAANLIDWGHTIGSAHASAWRWFAWIDDEGASYAGTGLGSASFPSGLLGRRYSTSPVSLDGSTSVLSTSGPTYAGEYWTIKARYEHGPDSIFPSVAPSPRQACWLDSTGSNSLVFDLHTGAEATGLLGRPLALAMLGTNAQTASLYGWTGAAWTLVVQWDATVTGGAGYVRSGRIVGITSGGTVGFVTRNQCVGWTLDLGGGKVRRVVANAEGQVGATSSFAAAFQIDADGTEGTSGTCYLYSDRAVAVVAQPSSYYRFKLTIGATTTPEGYLILGKVLLGSLAVLARRPSNGRQLTFTQQVQTTRPPGGPRSWRKLGPSYRRVPLEFGELLPTSQIFGASPAPDYVKLSTAGAGSAALHAAALSAVGLVEENMGRHVCYVGNIAQTSSNTATSNYFDPRQITYGLLTDPGTLTVVRGDEASSEVLTLAGVTLEEEP
jgi:hypothetical protein